jgi:hypothetical protein
MNRRTPSFIRRPLVPVVGLSLGLALGGVALTGTTTHAQDNPAGSAGRSCLLSDGLLLPDGWDTNEGIFRVRCVDGRLVIIGLASERGSRPGPAPVLPVTTSGVAVGH